MENRSWHQHYDYHVNTDLRVPRIPIQHFLDIPANLYPDKAAIHFLGTQISFWELREFSLRMANALKSLGIEKGDRIGIHLINIPQYVMTYYAAVSLGAIVVNFNPIYTADELKSLIKQTDITAIITMDIAMDVIKEVLSEVNIPNVIVTSAFDFKDGVNPTTAQSLGLEKEWHHFSELLENFPQPDPVNITISSEDPALIQFTGGTTGLPKGAVLTHRNVVGSVISSSLWGESITRLVMPENRSVMCALPLFHVYANILCMNWAMYNCATLILVPRFEINKFMEILAGYEKITFLPAVPTMINAIINHPRAKEIQLGKKIDMLNSGGGPIPVDLITQVKKLGITCSEGWGMSETTSIGIANPVLGLKKLGSIGIPAPGMDIKLVDIDTGEQEVPQGEPGELLVKGPYVMKEYWNNPEKTKAELKDGWLSTGDIVTMDEDGYLFIVDRKKDMIIAGGYNIYPRDIDEVLYKHPGVLEAISVGVPHEYRGETVKAFVVLKEGEAADENEIIDFCKKSLAAYKVPKIVEFCSELPKSGVGKILRKVLRDREIAQFNKDKGT